MIYQNKSERAIGIKNEGHLLQIFFIKEKLTRKIGILKVISKSIVI